MWKGSGFQILILDYTLINMKHLSSSYVIYSLEISLCIYMSAYIIYVCAHICAHMHVHSCGYLSVFTAISCVHRYTVCVYMYVHVRVSVFIEHRFTVGMVTKALSTASSLFEEGFLTFLEHA